MLSNSIIQKLADKSIYLLSSAGSFPSRENIRKVIVFIFSDPTLEADVAATEENIELISEVVNSRYGLSQDFGSMLADPDSSVTPWLANKRAEINPYYWKRYRMFLFQNSFPPKVIDTLDRITEQVLDYLQDPDAGGTWYRRGMVVGHVQSGKTANYLGLINKAADAGYKLIIILAGTIENLRKQTQERVDEGFIGKVSTGRISHFSALKGVGLIDQNLIPLTLTDSALDFRRDTNVDPKMYVTPTILIIKKNARILTRLNEWLLKSNTDHNNRIQKLPLLMIDDEADNASINIGRDQLNSPSAINAGIRGILNLFNRKCYIAYTATPFANIFIDPDTDSEMLGHDLFPKDFIKSLDPPENYFGPDRLFNSSASGSSNIRLIDDIHTIIPLKHKKTLKVEYLPATLRTAVHLHVLTAALKLTRGMHSQHHSMLVHMSRFVDVQEQIKDLLRSFVQVLTDNIRLYSRAASGGVSISPHLNELHELFQKEFISCGVEWEELTQHLLTAAASIQVYSINSKSADQLNYSEYGKTGLNVIVVGGDRLSRGLTLENLTVSYFYRNTSMYDTLMQMGRWFGYRIGYEDLCRIFMTPMAEGYFQNITDSVEELRNEFKLMEQMNKRPIHFGLKVRRHPNALMITARNKMRSAEVIRVSVDLTGRLVESYTVFYGCPEAEQNFHALSTAVGRMFVIRNPQVNDQSNYFWPRIPAEEVAKFITDYKGHPAALATNAVPLLKYLRKILPYYPEWDVVLVNIPRNELLNSDYIKHIAPIQKLSPAVRSCKLIESDGLEIGGNRRIDNTRAEIAGLTPAEISTALSAAGSKDISKLPGHLLRQFRARPLLMLHVIQPKFDDIRLSAPPAVAYGISFPKNSALETDPVEYAVNTIYAKHSFSSEDLDSDLEED